MFFLKVLFQSMCLAVGLFAVGCAGHLRLNSVPEKATVEVITGAPAPAKVGETPLSVNDSELSKHNARGPYVFRISKDGYEPQDLIVNSLSGVNIDYLLNLKPRTTTTQVNELVEDLFKAQTLAQKSNFVESLSILEKLAVRFPDVAAIPELQASIHMLRKEYSIAEKLFAKALSLNPENLELKALREAALKAAGGI
jgi:tetratricopeptide (TPR) repeat protein